MCWTPVSPGNLGSGFLGHFFAVGLWRSGEFFKSGLPLGATFWVACWYFTGGVLQGPQGIWNLSDSNFILQMRRRSTENFRVLAPACRQWGKLEFVSFMVGVVLTHSGPFSILLASPRGPRTSPSPPPSTVTALAQDLGLLPQSLLDQSPTLLEAGLTEEPFQC